MSSVVKQNTCKEEFQQHVWGADRVRGGGEMGREGEMMVRGKGEEGEGEGEKN